LKHTLRLRDRLRVEILAAEDGASVAEALRALARPAIEAPCGGRGLCGKCRIRVLEGLLSEPDGEERRLLSATELGAGFRLACRARVLGDAELELPERGNSPAQAAIGGMGGGASLGVGVDIGTTTVRCRLVDLRSGESLGARAELNAQRGYGADVISRIAASEEAGGLEALRDGIRSQLARMIAGLVGAAGSSPAGVDAIAIAGNTTMLHILAGVAPGTLARAPFTPAFLDLRSESALELGLTPRGDCPAYLLPGLSAFVGADIAAGMAAVGLPEMPGSSLYLDLGTNGEMALGGREGILCCSAAAGPAFEGAGIEKGSCGLEGAIDSAWIEGGSIRCGTIGGAPATGICGSGLIDALAAFLDLGLVDETGRVADGGRLYLDEARELYLSQADVRAAQLAKAAIAAGVDCLLRAAGIGADGVGRLYLAGGFGGSLGLRGAARIGLVPPGLADRVVVAGDAALAGATAACLSGQGREACARAASLCEYVELSGRADFNEAFVERMMFPGPLPRT
jgi:uncharacterized 2Fe-2S/4Fe-4S cluster protein (DUF4445 family)